jgi:hypothetical protein
MKEGLNAKGEIPGDIRLNDDPFVSEASQGRVQQ